MDESKDFGSRPKRDKSMRRDGGGHSGYPGEQTATGRI